jgi:DNA-binding beta-propeller fold protein YncE
MLKRLSLISIPLFGLGLAACGDDTPPDPPPAATCTKASGEICTVMGAGKAGLGMDGVEPEKVLLYLPQDIGFGPSGEIYVLDWNNHRVRTVRNGKVETILGVGYLGDAPEGQAREIPLNHPTHITFSPSGKMIISAWHNSKVLEMDLSTEHVKPVCGTGARDYGGDGGPAATALLDLPIATAFDSQGRMLIMDQANQRIRRIDTDGMISTVVGPGPTYVPEGFTRVCADDGMGGMTCKVCKADQATDPMCEPQKPKPQGFKGDGGPATEALLYLPFGQSAPPTGRMEMGPNDKLYIADTGNHRIRVFSADGMINTVAGSGPAMFDRNFTGGLSGNGGPATMAQFKRPTDVAVAPDGTFYVADNENHCIRKVDPSGTITAFAGTCGQPGFAGDFGPAISAKLDRPYGVALDAEGNLYIADTHNHRVRVVYK